MASCGRVLGPGLQLHTATGGLGGGPRSKRLQSGCRTTPYATLAPKRVAHQQQSQHTSWARQNYGNFITKPLGIKADVFSQRLPILFGHQRRIRVSQGNPGQIKAGHAVSGVAGETHHIEEDDSDLADDTRSAANTIKPGHVSLDEAVPLHLNKAAASQDQSQPSRKRRFGNRLRRRINGKAADILNTFRKEEKMEVEYATEEEELAALNEQRYKLASGLKRTLFKIGVCFIVLAVIKILNALREALLASPVDYFKLIGVLGSLDYWALAALVFDIRNTISEIERNDGDGDPTVRVLEQENVAIGISFEKFFKRMFKVLSAIAFAQVLGALSMTGFQFAPNVDSGLKQLWSFVSPHL